ncbi:hypothetical protein P8452_58647 [Trifolium repens]|nr:hypothetical protein P8452_58647 [Trifolium repens]
MLLHSTSFDHLIVINIEQYIAFYVMFRSTFPSSPEFTRRLADTPMSCQVDKSLLDKFSSVILFDTLDHLIRIFAYHEKVDWMYYLAFGAVVTGIVIYSISYGDEDQHPPNAVEEPTAIRRDEEVGSARYSKGPVAGSSKS